MVQRRYECLAGPCGHWTVWDREAAIPATYDGQVLAGLSAADAKKIAALLNVMHEPLDPQMTADGVRAPRG